MDNSFFLIISYVFWHSRLSSAVMKKHKFYQTKKYLTLFLVPWKQERLNVKSEVTRSFEIQMEWVIIWNLTKLSHTFPNSLKDADRLVFFSKDSVPAHPYFCHKREQSNSSALSSGLKDIFFAIYKLSLF